MIKPRRVRNAYLASQKVEGVRDSLYNPNDLGQLWVWLNRSHSWEASHELVTTAIHGLDRMQHRGGIAADGKTGDGCGLLLQKPDAFAIMKKMAETQQNTAGRFS